MSQPIQYQDGNVEFFGRTFFSDSRALIPRFETEFLVSKTIAWCAEKDPQKAWSIIDIGTGSGVIAISLALELPTAKITAIDASAPALALAGENALRHNVVDKVHLMQGNLLEGFHGPADIIVANLPYLPTGRIPQLDPSVKDFEPHEALDGGTDGLELYRHLFNQISQLTHPPSFCIFEIDDGQEDSILEIVSKYLPDMKAETLKDTSNLYRYLMLTK